MFRQIQLSNFRGFQEHTTEFGKVSVLVGRNNAGKSSLIESIRIVATLLKRMQSGRFSEAPKWLPNGDIGLTSSLSDVERRSDALFHRYSEPPAQITATFETGSKLEIFLGEDLQVHAQGFDPDGHIITSSNMAKTSGFPTIAILPQISPLKDRETVLRKPYVEQCMESHLASRHFRNQLRYFHKHYEDFREAFGRTWPGIDIWSFESADAAWEEPLFLMLREDGFVAEVADFGHGVQMWLQITWFLSRIDRNSIVVLDEPDVYLHPDQQSEILNMLRTNYSQCVVSTHAHAILNSCERSEILRLDRRSASSAVGRTEKIHQRILKTSLEETVASRREKRNALIEISLAVYDDADAIIKSQDGTILLAAAPDGKKQTISVPHQVVDVELKIPSDVDLFINKQAVHLEDYYRIPTAAFSLDLAEYA